MCSGSVKYFFGKLPKIWLYTIWLGTLAVMVSSCGGSKKSPGIRQMEKQSKNWSIDANGNPVDMRSKKVRETLAKQEKQKEAAAKEAEKNRQDGITRHRAFQTQETRDRMDQNLKESEKRYSAKKDFFLVRWFRPKDSVEKIEKRRAKEVKKRMAATRKQAEKNNKERNTSGFKTSERKKPPKPDPNAVQHGGGGSYNEGKSKNRVNPSDIQQGGGGSYNEGKSKSKAKPSDTQQGGGGSYQKVKPNKK